MKSPIVVDTNVFIAALMNPFGESASVIERCFQGDAKPIMGTALFLEYEDVLNRNALFRGCLLAAHERNQILDDFLSVSRWVRVYYGWRPNLKDEDDNHIMELAIAGSVQAIITHNIRDFEQADLTFPDIAILTPTQWLQERT